MDIYFIHSFLIHHSLPLLQSIQLSQFGGFPLFINVLANIGIISLTIYLYFRSQQFFTVHHWKTWQMRIVLCLSEVIIGSILMKYAIVVDSIHFDFRFLLIALSFIYLGWQVTIPSILLLSFIRIFISTDWMSLGIFVYNLWLMISLPFLTTWIKKHFLIFAQLNILIFYMIFGAIILQIFYHHLTWQITLDYLLLLFWGIFASLLLNYYIADLTKIYTESTIDHLTKLANRQLFDQALKALEHTSSVAIAIFDIDYFKQYNDSFGHNTGDQVLQLIGNYFKSFEDSYCHFYRFGGEEFVCLMTYSQPSDNQKKLQMIQENIASYCQQQAPNLKAITLSQGIAFRKPDESLLKTFKRCDKALYQAKHLGRNCTVIAK